MKQSAWGLVVAVMLFAGCAATRAPRTATQPMTAAQHRARAAFHLRKAAEAESQYQRGAWERFKPSVLADQVSPVEEPGLDPLPAETVNRTVNCLRRATWHRWLARYHATEARRLEGARAERPAAPATPPEDAAAASAPGAPAPR